MLGKRKTLHVFADYISQLSCITKCFVNPFHRQNIGVHYLTACKSNKLHTELIEKSLYNSQANPMYSSPPSYKAIPSGMK